jgi:hypothetical protein
VAIPLGPAGLAERQRADIVVAGLDQAGPSFELRIFLNAPGADAATERVARTGYAGSIHIYGYGNAPEGADASSGSGSGSGSSRGARLPMTRRLTVTDAIRAAASEGTEMSVTLVPVAFQTPEPDIDLGEIQVSMLVHE